MSSPPFEGRTAVVTGAAGGIGRAIAAELAAGGADLVLVDRDGDGLAATSSALGSGRRDVALACDLADDAAAEEVVAAAVDAFGRVDVLVNNAGITRFGRAEVVCRRDWDDVMDVNVRAPFLLSQAVGRDLLRSGRRGCIVNIGSIGGRTANPQNVPYGVSKAALLALTQQLAVEWGPAGIRVNAVNPGLMTWHMQGVEVDPDVKRRQAGTVPLRRLAEPADIADAVAFLASDRARCVTGVMIDVDGGYLLSVMSAIPRPEALVRRLRGGG